MKNKNFDLTQRNLQDEFNSTIHYIVKFNHTRSLTDLIKLHSQTDEFQINSKNHKNKTALHMACENQLEKIALTLLSVGADPNVRDLNKNTPLHILCKVGNTDFVPQFLDSCLFDIDLSMKDGKGKMAYQICDDPEVTI